MIQDDTPGDAQPAPATCLGLTFADDAARRTYFRERLAEKLRDPFCGERRWWNVKPAPEYIRRMEAGLSPERAGEAIDRRLAMGETMMLGLRLVREGVTDARFRARFGARLDEAFGNEIAGLVARGLLERLPDRVRLTPQGRLLGNQVFAGFLA